MLDLVESDLNKNVPIIYVSVNADHMNFLINFRFWLFVGLFLVRMEEDRVEGSTEHREELLKECTPCIGMDFESEDAA